MKTTQLLLVTAVATLALVHYLPVVLLGGIASGCLFGVIWLVTSSAGPGVHRQPSRSKLLSSLSIATPEPSKDEQCIICRDAYSVPVRLACAHVYCKECIRAWCERGQSRCPICQQVFCTIATSAGLLLVVGQATAAMVVVGLDIFLIANQRIAWPAPIAWRIAETVAWLLIRVFGLVSGGGYTMKMFRTYRQAGKEWWRQASMGDEEGDIAVLLILGGLALEGLAEMQAQLWRYSLSDLVG